MRNGVKTKNCGEHCVWCILVASILIIPVNLSTIARVVKVPSEGMHCVYFTYFQCFKIILISLHDYFHVGTACFVCIVWALPVTAAVSFLPRSHPANTRPLGQAWSRGGWYWLGFAQPHQLWARPGPGVGVCPAMPALGQAWPRGGGLPSHVSSGPVVAGTG
jgi:hypothetical protein